MEHMVCFEKDDDEGLQKSVNDWLSTVKNIKITRVLQSSGSGGKEGSLKHLLTIFYKEIKKTS